MVISIEKSLKERCLRFVDTIYIQNIDDIRFAVENEKLIYISENGIGIVTQPKNISTENITVFIERDIKNEEQFNFLYDELLNKVTQIKNSKYSRRLPTIFLWFFIVLNKIKKNTKNNKK